jgi:hypothetical protein
MNAMLLVSCIAVERKEGSPMEDFLHQFYQLAISKIDLHEDHINIVK